MITAMKGRGGGSPRGAILVFIFKLMITMTIMIELLIALGIVIGIAILPWL